MIEVRHLPTAASRDLALRIAALVPEVTVTEEPDDTSDPDTWERVRIYDSGDVFTSLTWLRGASRDLDQAAAQLAHAIRCRDTGIRVRPDGRQVPIRHLKEELGIVTPTSGSYVPMGRRRRGKK